MQCTFNDDVTTSTHATYATCNGEKCKTTTVQRVKKKKSPNKTNKHYLYSKNGQKSVKSETTATITALRNKQIKSIKHKYAKIEK